MSTMQVIEIFKKIFQYADCREDERFRSDELRVALEASELQCRQMAERNYQLLADNHKYIDEVNKVQVEKMRQMEQEKAEAVQLAVDIRDQLKDLRER